MSDNERIVNGYTIKPGADLAFADLREFDLRGCDLRGCNLAFADLRGCDLRGCDLQGCDLRGCDLRGCDLRFADLASADLRCADLRYADLRGCDLRFASLASADLPLGLLWAGDLAHYRVAVGYGYASVGCQRHPYAVWRELTEATAREWDGEGAVQWWRAHRETLLQMIAEAEAATPDTPKEGE